MQALGLIETRGLLPAIECADIMLKTAQVKLVKRTFLGSGLVTITVTGDVGAVKAAVEAGVTAVKKLEPLSLVSHHVIPRPHPDIENMVVERANNPDANQNPATELTEPATTAPESTNPEQIILNQLSKAGVDALVWEFGLEKSVDVLKSLSVVKLRNLAREYKDLGVAGRAISKANKENLIQKLTSYYERRSES
ncbi:MAG: BMC domain-containing protein [Bacillota bacterium]